MPLRLSGKKVKDRMLALNITPAELTKRSGLSPSTIDRIANDRANSYSNYTVKRLADALKMDFFPELRPKEGFSAPDEGK